MDQLVEFKARYDAYVRANPTKVRSVEQMGPMVAMMFPSARLSGGSAEKAELITEFLYMAISLSSQYNDSLLRPSTADEKDYGSATTTLSFGIASKIRTVLTTVSNCEVVLEMSARTLGSDEKRRKLIVFLEFAKALLRTALLFKTQCTVLPMSGLLEGRSPQEDEEEKNEQTSPASPSANQSNGGRPVASSASWRGRRTGRILRGTSTSESSLESSRSSNAKIVAGPRYARFSGISKTDRLLYLVGELLHIFRPALYAYMVFRRRMEKSWTPWFLSLALELASARCTFVALEGNRSNDRNASSSSDDQFNDAAKEALERFIGSTRGTGSPNASRASPSQAAVAASELQRRRVLFAYYLMRNPCFDAITKPAVGRIGNSLARLPLIGALGGYLVEALTYYHRHHFYVSAS